MADPDPHDMQHLERSRMSFGAHLEELRSRLIRAVLATLAGFAGVFIFNREAMEVVVAPYQAVMLELNQSPTLSFLGVPQAFFGYMKVALVGGLLLAAPVWIYQLWAFMSAGLYRKERTVFYRYAPFSLVLLLGGVFFGYTLLLPIGIRYLITFGDPTVVQSAITLSEYLSLFTILTLLLGIAFQLPLVMVALTRMGVVSVEFFQTKRRWMILGIFVMAAVITPPDVITQLLVGVPLVLLHELGIFLSWLGQGERRPRLDRARLKRRARKVAIAVLAIFLLWKPIRGLQHEFAVEGWVCRGEEERLPDMKQVIEALVKVPVTFAIRCGEDGAATLIAARTKSGPGVFAVAPGNRRLVVVDRSAADAPPSVSIRYHPAGSPVYDATMPASVPFEAFVPRLLLALEHLEDDGERQAVQDLLERFSDRSLGSTFDDALGAARNWLAEVRGGAWTNRKF